MKDDLRAYIGCSILLGVALLCAAVFTAFGAAWGFTVTGLALIGLAVRLAMVYNRKTL